MCKITMKKRLINALLGEEVDKMPVVSITQTGTEALMDICDAKWPEAHYDPKLMAKLAIAAHKEIGYEAVRVPYCLTILLEALGCQVSKGHKTRQPSITSHPYNSREPLPLKPISNDFLSKGRIPVILKTIKLIREEIGEDIPIIAGSEGPVTIASDLLEVTTYMKWFIKQKQAVVKYTNYGANAVIEYANALFEAGADVFALLDPVASPDLINPRDFNEIVLPIYQRMSKKLKGKVVVHICGDITGILSYLKETGFDAVSIEEKTDLEKAKEIFESKIRVVGNVATATTLFNGTPKQTYDESIIALNKGTDVLAPGCGLAPLSPLENCKAMVEARDDYFK